MDINSHIYLPVSDSESDVYERAGLEGGVEEGVGGRLYGMSRGNGPERN